MTTSPSALTSPGVDNDHHSTLLEASTVIFSSSSHRLSSTLLSIYDILFEGDPENLKEFPSGTLLRIQDVMHAAGFSHEAILATGKKEFRCIVSCTNYLSAPKLVPVVVKASMDTPEQVVIERAKEVVREKMQVTDTNQVFLPYHVPAYLFDSFYWGDATITEILPSPQEVK